MNSDFKDLITLLNQFEVEYLIAGGYAVMLYSQPRYTKEIDIAIALSAENASRTARALAEFGFPLSREAELELAQFNRMIMLGLPPHRIDVLNHLEGIDFDEAYARKNVVIVEGLAVPFISREDLIAAKRAAGRPQDLVDLEALEASG